MSYVPTKFNTTFRCHVGVLYLTQTPRSCTITGRMSSVNLVVLVESVQELITHSGTDDKFHIPSLVAVGVALGAPVSIPLSSYV